jgi:hypothetical protein
MVNWEKILHGLEIIRMIDEVDFNVIRKNIKKCKDVDKSIDLMKVYDVSNFLKYKLDTCATKNNNDKEIVEEENKIDDKKSVNDKKGKIYKSKGEWYERNKEIVKEKNRIYKLEHREQIKKQKAEYYASKKLKIKK